MPSPTNKRQTAAIKKQNRGYAFSVAIVTDAEWVSQFEAASELRMNLTRVGTLIASRQLVPVHNKSGQAGVARESLKNQCVRRADAGALRRFSLIAGDAFKLLARGI